jgi:hypothetical protein
MTIERAASIMELMRAEAPLLRHSLALLEQEAERPWAAVPGPKQPTKYGWNIVAT